MKPHAVILLILIYLLSSCSPGRDPLEEALAKSGSNRHHLKAAISHFSRKGDTLGVEAARRIIADMPLHWGYDSLPLARRIECYRQFAVGRKVWDYRITDSIAAICRAIDLPSTRKIPDLLTADSTLLIDDVEAALLARRRWPWAASVPVETFISHVVPYRVGDESLSHGWRRKLQQRFLNSLDSIASLEGCDDPLTAANEIRALLPHMTWTSDIPGEGRLGPASTELAYGTCQDFADRLIFLLRAAGIPAGCDRMIVRGDGNTPHSWAYVIGNDGKTYIDITDSFRPVGERDFNLLKVFRETFSPVSDGLSPTPHLRDVTGVYLEGEGSSLVIPLDSLLSLPQEGEVPWICSASHREWVPVAPGIVSGDRRFLSFGAAGAGSMAIIAARSNDGRGFRLISHPFRTVAGGSHRFIQASGTSREVTLFRKYTPSIGEFAHRMVGGVVEGADDPGFSSGVETLALIREEPFRLFTTATPHPHRPHRYFRYRGPDGSNCNIAELSLFGEWADTIPLKGEPIGTEGCWGNDDRRSFRAVFDGDPYTSFDYIEPSGGWAGLDLGQPRTLARIVFAPRNRDNFIRRGDLYELFFWDNRPGSGSPGWVSAGSFTATSDSIAAEVPDGALLYLANRSRGYDERIFTIDPSTGRQRF